MQQINERELLERHGIRNPGRIYYNCPIPELYEEVI
jgi:hypothetical protein